MANTDYVTVYRSADPDAEDDAVTARDLLRDAGIPAEVAGDDAPGVVEGTWEVRVPAGEVERAEGILAAAAEQVEQHVDPSHELDLVDVFRSEGGTTAEVEALAVRGILDANGIPNVLIGASTLPNLGFEVRVPKQYEEQAQAALAQAAMQGPAAAEEEATLPPEAEP